MRKIFLLLMPFILISLASARSSATDKHYHVVHIVDGDTFDATDGQITFRVRVAGMDAPESKQEFGKWATVELKKLIEGKEITIQPIAKGLDRYNRILGQVFLEGEDISLLMIQKGFAFYYRPRCRDYPEDKQLYDYDPRSYVDAEKAARATEVVIWSKKSVKLPCQFRKEHPYH
ncbi:MAG: thermonuclease family protein [Deltaproteobacteria bacterium]|nr:thermonuclease family protein [Deltaproteobacteria bacterium]